MKQREAVKANSSGPGKMVQWVKCFPCKHEDLSLDPQHVCENLGGLVCVLIPLVWGGIGRRDGQIPRA